ncbi:MAG TPA: hypothetical protein PK089_00855 [Methanoregulaceae archaeon]|nr:hypothetical protein [Methanoregulaceae archaeon]HQJ87350.1 hypothetical protein [Methanoregulaceae archaeon]
MLWGPPAGRSKTLAHPGLNPTSIGPSNAPISVEPITPDGMTLSDRFFFVHAREFSPSLVRVSEGVLIGGGG